MDTPLLRLDDDNVALRWMKWTHLCDGCEKITAMDTPMPSLEKE